MWNRYEESLVDLNKLLAIEPNIVEELRTHEELLVLLNKSLEIEPCKLFLLRICGDTYRMLKSLVNLNKLLEIDSNNTEALKNQIEPNTTEALSEREETYYKVYRFEESLADLYQLFAIETNNALRYMNCIEWISFDRLIDRQIIGKSGFGTVFSAIWLDDDHTKLHLKLLIILNKLNGLGLEIYGITQDIETQTCLIGVFGQLCLTKLCSIIQKLIIENFFKINDCDRD
ncbi:hypothetical protein C2G38_2205877 [Gigaspora rosea]|uniref:Protein kinase domain-containing protein n=1 Tax=Gigaspora rosea TaxID=44941 RepID=A0A397UP78_9GLOM|nr:hypothetical protein C2G38_2205877 [Gigaspora rosea]